MPKEIIEMSKRELKRLELIHKVMDKRIKQKVAAQRISLSARHLRRLIKKVSAYGDTAIVHGNRGRLSNRKYSDEFRNKTIGIIKKNITISDLLLLQRNWRN